MLRPLFPHGAYTSFCLSSELDGSSGRHGSQCLYRSTDGSPGLRQSLNRPGRPTDRLPSLYHSTDDSPATCSSDESLVTASTDVISSPTEEAPEPLAAVVETEAPEPLAAVVETEAPEPLAAVVETEAHGPLAAVVETEAPEPLAAVVETEAPEPLAAVVETEAHGPLAAVVETEAPEPLAAVVETEAPEPLAAVVETEAHGPLAAVVETEAPEPLAAVVETEVPEPLAVVVETEAPEPLAVVVETEAPEPLAAVVETEAPEPLAAVVETEAPGPLAAVVETEAARNIVSSYGSPPDLGRREVVCVDILAEPLVGDIPLERTSGDSTDVDSSPTEARGPVAVMGAAEAAEDAINIVSSDESYSDHSQRDELTHVDVLDVTLVGDIPPGRTSSDILTEMDGRNITTQEDMNDVANVGDIWAASASIVDTTVADMLVDDTIDIPCEIIPECLTKCCDYTAENITGENTGHLTDEATPADMTDETTPADMTDETTPADITDETTPADITDETTLAGMTDETTPSGITDETTPADMTDETTPAGVTDEIVHVLRDKTPLCVYLDESPDYDGDIMADHDPDPDGESPDANIGTITREANPGKDADQYVTGETIQRSSLPESDTKTRSPISWHPAFVQNLSASMSDGEVRGMFSTHGRIEHISRRGRCAVVYFRSSDEAHSAADDLHGARVNDRTLLVWCKNRSKPVKWATQIDDGVMCDNAGESSRQYEVLSWPDSHGSHGNKMQDRCTLLAATTASTSGVTSTSLYQWSNLGNATKDANSGTQDVCQYSASSRMERVKNTSPINQVNRTVTGEQRPMEVGHQKNGAPSKCIISETTENTTERPQKHTAGRNEVPMRCDDDGSDAASGSEYYWSDENTENCLRASPVGLVDGSGTPRSDARCSGAVKSLNELPDSRKMAAATRAVVTSASVLTEQDGVKLQSSVVGINKLSQQTCRLSGLGRGRGQKLWAKAAEPRGAVARAVPSLGAPIWPDPRPAYRSTGGFGKPQSGHFMRPAQIVRTPTDTNSTPKEMSALKEMTAMCEDTRPSRDGEHQTVATGTNAHSPETSTRRESTVTEPSVLLSSPLLQPYKSSNPVDIYRVFLEQKRKKYHLMIDSKTWFPVYVRNLPLSMIDEDVHLIFRRYGNIQQLSRSGPFAVVYYGRDGEADWAARQLNGHLLRDETLLVSCDNPYTQLHRNVHSADTELPKNDTKNVCNSHNNLHVVESHLPVDNSNTQNSVEPVDTAQRVPSGASVTDYTSDSTCERNNFRNGPLFVNAQNRINLKDFFLPRPVPDSQCVVNSAPAHNRLSYHVYDPQFVGGSQLGHAGGAPGCVRPIPAIMSRCINATNQNVTNPPASVQGVQMFRSPLGSSSVRISSPQRGCAPPGMVLPQGINVSQGSSVPQGIVAAQDIVTRQGIAAPPSIGAPQGMFDPQNIGSSQGIVAPPDSAAPQSIAAPPNIGAPQGMFAPHDIGFSQGIVAPTNSSAPPNISAPQGMFVPHSISAPQGIVDPPNSGAPQGIAPQNISAPQGMFVPHNIGAPQGIVALPNSGPPQSMFLPRNIGSQHSTSAPHGIVAPQGMAAPPVTNGQVLTATATPGYMQVQYQSYNMQQTTAYCPVPPPTLYRPDANVPWWMSPPPT